MRRPNINAHRRRRPAFGPEASRSAEEIILDDVMDDQTESALARPDPRFRSILLLVDVDQLT